MRAELAYHSLKDAGYKSRFPNAIVKIDPAGRYEITKECKTSEGRPARPGRPQHSSASPSSDPPR
ncbi:MAG: hypothetical protein MZV64_71310 [Ignavibacteriales bacterium]|nr:hypothetical protein [Ignavibacteriales bacterium]